MKIGMLFVSYMNVWNNNFLGVVFFCFDILLCMLFICVNYLGLKSDEVS